MWTRRANWVVVFGIAFAATGCSGRERIARNEPGCKDRKPGIIVTVNDYCVVQLEDPVNPAIGFVEWRGQKVGFCCKGCMPKWNQMTDAEKDEAVRVAVAKGKLPPE